MIFRSFSTPVAPMGLLFLAGVAASGQIAPPVPPAPAPRPAPFAAQIKKTIVFIQTDCSHKPTPQEIAAIQDKGKGQQPDQPKVDSVVGTGFIFYVPDERAGHDRGFAYLVTNRHVVQPGIEDSRPCEVVNYSVRLNLKVKDKDKNALSPLVPLEKGAKWMFPDDPSVDLAALPVGLDEKTYDFQEIPIGMVATQETMNTFQITEGDSVLFAGLFVQYTGQTRMEPIVRQGSLAMLPDGMIQTTLKKPGKVYLAEAHVFGGNSGSPMFVNVGGVRGGALSGADYRMLGVVAGEFYETTNFELQPAVSYKGVIAANSGISMIVPAEQLKAFIESAAIQKQRDGAVALIKGAAR